MRRYQIESPGPSARIDVNLDMAAVEPGATPIEAATVPVNDSTPVDIDIVSELPMQEGIKSHEGFKETTQSIGDEDLFGDNTVTEPVSAMSPPRY